VNPLSHIARRAGGVLGVAAILVGPGTASALAAPSFQVQLDRQANEIQNVSVKASGGEFRLGFGSGAPGEPETGDIKFNASAAEVQNALNALPDVKKGGNGAVSVDGVDSYYGVTFSGGLLANTDVPQLRGRDGTVPLSGAGARVITRTYYAAAVSRSDEMLKYIASVKNSGSDPTIGMVTLEVELPGGLETSVFRVQGNGWNCVKSAAAGAFPAKAACTRSDGLSPGASYPDLAVVAKLGTDVPNHAVATAKVSGGTAAGASGVDEFDFASPKPFEIENFDSEVIGSDGNDYTQAGGHPFSAGISFQMSTFQAEAFGSLLFVPRNPIERPRQVVVDLPRGLVANPLAVPLVCPSVEDVIAKTCPAGSAVGQIDADLTVGQTFDFLGAKLPIFSITPEVGLPAQFAFAELDNINTPFTLSPRLRADDGYAISLDTSPTVESPSLRRLHEGVFCGFGAKVTGNKFEGCRDKADPLANDAPLITNPTRCTGAPPTTKVSSDSWEHPGDFVSAEVSDPSNTDCAGVDFQPEVSLKPTNKQADTPTGVDVEITMPTDGLESNSGRAQANLDNAVVTFPKGMSLNPAAAHGLGSCAPSQVKLGSNDDDACPLSSQVGTIEIDTPLISETLKGHVFLASQKSNPFSSTLGLYMVFASKKDGVTIKVAGKLEPDLVTGQLTASFVENPEAPFSRLALKFNSGPRAPLLNPPRCGTYAIHSEMSPWSAASPANPTAEETVSADSVFEVTAGPNGGPCPNGGLEPKFEAGLQNATAGSKSPFVLRVSREDGSARFSGLDVSMPKGVTAYLKGIPYCPEHVLAGISGAELTGGPELVNPACLSASQVGTVQAGAGAGPYPFYAPGRAYLAGPYKGAPISIAVVAPAVAGPFDLGNVVVRNALYVDPVTAQVTVKSDPIPTILHGVLLDIRDLRVSIDRPGFTAAPTNCEPASIQAQIRGEGGMSVNRATRFQVGDCAALGFKPKLALRLFGGTKRGAHPRLKATLTARAGDANIAGASVALPHSEFLDQAHIRTVCTRVQFKANACPAAAIYGSAEARTPLLDNPLRGPVYLRSSDNPLPDLVAALRGPDSQPIEVVLAGRIDSVHGGIRSSFEAVPDQPVSSFTLSMQGGKKGLLVNSRNICKTPNRATTKFRGQNGMTVELRPVLQNSCKKASKKQKRRSGR
jgi:hypothetical protein